MKYYFEHVLALYVSYMKLALSGMLLSAILLSFYSVIVISAIVWKVIVALVVLGLAGQGILMLRRRSAEQRELELEQVREQHERERLAQAKRNEERMNEARNYLRFTKTSAISDHRRISDDLLVDDLVVLMDQLQAEKVEDGLIKEAIERFLIIVGEAENSFIFSVRQKILRSIISDAIISNTIINQPDQHETREFIS